jgi:hypothetical protein
MAPLSHPREQLLDPSEVVVGGGPGVVGVTGEARLSGAGLRGPADKRSRRPRIAEVKTDGTHQRGEPFVQVACSVLGSRRERSRRVIADLPR